MRGLHLWVPGSEAHPLVEVVGAAVVGIDGGDQIGSGQSSGARGFGATACGRTSRLHLRGLRELTSPTEVRTRPFGHWSLVGDKFVRRRGSVFKGATATSRNQGGEEVDSVRKLTVVTQRSSDGSGRRRGRRTVAGDLGAEAAGSSSMAKLHCFWRCVARRGGRGGNEAELLGA